MTTRVGDVLRKLTGADFRSDVPGRGLAYEQAAARGTAKRRR